MQKQQSNTSSKTDDVVEDLPGSVDTIDSEAIIAEIDSVLDGNDDDLSGDDLLLDAARNEKAQKVNSTRNGAMQSVSSRAWTRGGSVD